MKKKTKKWIWTALIAGVVITAVGPWTITHRYGPYSGKVVETETGEPIEGAYVLVAFYTHMFTLAGPVSEFVDTWDATTDKNGEFKIEPYRVWALRFLHGWNDEGSIVIYKPGYAGYSPHSIVAKEYVTERLKRLRTVKERWDALGSGMPVGIPDDKERKLRDLLDEERKNLGLDN
ncbi:MAG: hypothetical protein AB2L11_00960 [Syntrophobacteraceae bacterium]